MTRQVTVRPPRARRIVTSPYGTVWPFSCLGAPQPRMRPLHPTSRTRTCAPRRVRTHRAQARPSPTTHTRMPPHTWSPSHTRRERVRQRGVAPPLARLELRLSCEHARSGTVSSEERPGGGQAATCQARGGLSSPGSSLARSAPAKRGEGEPQRRSRGGSGHRGHRGHIRLQLRALADDRLVLSPVVTVAERASAASFIGALPGRAVRAESGRQHGDAGRPCCRQASGAAAHLPVACIEDGGSAPPGGTNRHCGPKK